MEAGGHREGSLQHSVIEVFQPSLASDATRHGNSGAQRREPGGAPSGRDSAAGRGWCGEEATAALPAGGVEFGRGCSGEDAMTALSGGGVAAGRGSCGEGASTELAAALPRGSVASDAVDAAEDCRETPSAQPLVPEEDERLEPALENISILAHLAVFAMIGVCTRYGLEILFGPRVLHVTDDIQALFLDIPPNMLGSLIMGVVGYVSKKDIAAYSEPLAIGLSTGLCGSITTYASWNQRMMSILAYGLVARALCGYVIGTALCYYSFLVGVDAAEGMRKQVQKMNEGRQRRGQPAWTPRPEHFQRRWGSLVLFVVLCTVLWIAAAIAFALDSSPPRLKKVALGCIVGPFGCWLRWLLSRLNGAGLGKRQRWKWLPVGTLAANQLAVATEAALSAVDAVHNSYMGSLLIGGLQLGFMGCLSTVSTLIQEVYSLGSAKASRWRAYVYLYLVSFLPSILLGILIYCIPVWVFGVANNGYNKVDPWDQKYLTSQFT